MSECWTVPKVWGKDRVFIIGGGPSLLQTPFLNRIGNKEYKFINKVRSRVIAVNQSFELFPYADVLYFGDIIWGDDNEIAIRKKWRGSEIVTRCSKNWEFPFKRLARDMTVGLSHSPNALAGWCSGSNAINLAYLYGAQEIVLLGFDMKGANWHTKYKGSKKENCYEVDFIPYLRRMAIDLKQTSCKVWNVTPDSALDCFECKPLGEFFK